MSRTDWIPGRLLVAAPVPLRPVTASRYASGLSPARGCPAVATAMDARSSNTWSMERSGGWQATVGPWLYGRSAAQPRYAPGRGGSRQ